MEQDNLLSLGMLFCGISIFCHCHLLKQFNLEIQILNEHLDSVLSPINLQGQTGCNCDLQPINYVCLVGISLLYIAALLIVKSGPWDRHDPRNNYNSDIDY